MPIDSSAFGRDMRGIIDDQPVSCSFGIVQFSATIGETRRNNDVSGEGTLYEANQEIMAVIDDFGGESKLPDVQDVIKVQDTNYHVEDRVIEPFGVTVHFILRRI